MKKILIFFSLIFIMLASFFVTYKFKTSSIPSGQITQTVAATAATTPVTPALNDTPVPESTATPITPEPTPTTVPVFYDILGTSTTPKKYPDSPMIKWRKDVVSLSKKYPSTVYINGQPSNKVVALTFDDGPDQVNTLKIVNILKSNNIQATFFCIGNQIESSKAVIKQAYANGNVIASHSWSHKDFTTLNATGVTNEIEKTESEIHKIIGRSPLLVRPPYGAINPTVQNLLTSLNYKSILWSIDTLDWAEPEVSNIVNNIVNNVRPGEIILMHCDGDKKITTKALPSIITKLKEMGYGFVTVDNLLDIPAYK